MQYTFNTISGTTDNGSPKSILSKIFNFIIFMLIAAIIPVLFPEIFEKQTEREKLKAKLKFFKPEITENFLGLRSTKWVSRRVPLSDEQLLKLIK